MTTSPLDYPARRRERSRVAARPAHVVPCRAAGAGPASSRRSREIPVTRIFIPARLPRARVQTKRDRVAPPAARRRARSPSRTPRAAARAPGARRRRHRPTGPTADGRPTITARAPSASALSTSVPRRTPPSTITSSRSPTASTIAGSASAADQHRVELAATVVGDDDPAGPVLGGQRGVLRRQQSLDDHRQRPVGGEALDV